MFKTSRIVFAAITLISSSAVNADMDTVTYAGSRTIEHYEEKEFVVNSMDAILNENLYEIQQETSNIAFRVDSPIGPVWARFENFEGSFSMLNSDAYNDPSSVVINAKSMDADSDFIKALLKSESFFDTENFPSMRFVGSSFEWITDKKAVLKGYMTIKNVTRQVAFYVELIGVNTEHRFSDRITVTASTTIRRSEFGINTLLPAIGDDVNVFMSIDALKQNTALSMN